MFENDPHNDKRTHRLRPHKREDANGIMYLGDGAWAVETRTVPDPASSWRLAKAAGRNHVWEVNLRNNGTAMIRAVDIEGASGDTKRASLRRPAEGRQIDHPLKAKDVVARPKTTCTRHPKIPRFQQVRGSRSIPDREFVGSAGRQKVGMSMDRVITNATMTLVANPRGREPAGMQSPLRFDVAILHRRPRRKVRIPVLQALPFTGEREPGSGPLGVEADAAGRKLTPMKPGV